MEMSKHAKARCQQRGCLAEDPWLIMAIGDFNVRPGNALEYHITKNDKTHAISSLKRLIKAVENF
ncbi:MAG TPA: hypothetical protein PKN24_16470 [bacterium]|mgnify:CR=1 FL=1|nr:hypothetical protein [bacterium]